MEWIPQTILYSSVAISLLIVIIFKIPRLINKKIEAQFGKFGIKIDNEGNPKTEYIQLTKADIVELFGIFKKTITEIIDIKINKDLDKKMLYAQQKIKDLLELKLKVYIEIAKRKVKIQNIENTIEYKYFIMMINTLFYVDEEDDSYKTIIRRELRNKNYKKQGTEYQDYINNFLITVLRKWNRAILFYFEADSYYDNKKHEWVVDYSDLFQLAKNERHIARIKDIIMDIFANAIDVDNYTYEQEQRLNVKNKNDIDQYFEKKKGE
jgi:hypothetical protein